MNLTEIMSTDHREISKRLKELCPQGAHFVNGIYGFPAQLAVPTTLAGFWYVDEREETKRPFVIAVNSDASTVKLNRKQDEDQHVRAIKVAKPLSQCFPDRQVIIIYYDEETPVELYKNLSAEDLTFSLHKWGYGQAVGAPRIEGADLFQCVFSLVPPNKEKPICHDITPPTLSLGKIQVVDLVKLQVITPDCKLLNRNLLIRLPSELREAYQTVELQDPQTAPPPISGQQPELLSKGGKDDSHKGEPQTSSLGPKLTPSNN